MFLQLCRQRFSDELFSFESNVVIPSRQLPPSVISNSEQHVIVENILSLAVPLLSLQRLDSRFGDKYQLFGFFSCGPLTFMLPSKGFQIT